MSDRQKVGLCVDCQHTKVIVSGKGSQFFLCQRAETDSCYSKYPRLPMLQCSGYEPQEQTGSQRKKSSPS
ncbi:MAG: hypothetical protein FJ147_03145 [Deltaproteobacteria bacterium]|nr:hypothetical protein [Deltaproteobacteria bacterium]